jgi:CheY-like chemotaxis protein
MSNGTQPKETTFLLVEDDENDVLLLKREFKKAPGHIILHVVYDGDEAIDYLSRKGKFTDEDKHPLPNIILLDLKMRRVTGFEFLEWLRTKAPEPLRLIPVLVMSSSSLEVDIQRAYALGANAYMVKPADWNLFRKRVADLGVYWAEHVETPAVH